MHVMVDIETTATSGYVPILTIGARVFDLKEGKSDNVFYARIDRSTWPADFVDDPQTLAWWDKQNAAAREEAFGGEEDAKAALQRFAAWLPRGALRMWSHGKEFDLPILSFTMQYFGIRVPWRFWNTLDTRTIYFLAGWRLPSGTSHHALEDCDAQIDGVVECYKRLII